MEENSGRKKMNRTKIYSGGLRRSGYTEVPKLFDMCILILQENVESIDECGGLSYDILEPVLSRAKPSALMNIEDYNDYLREDTAEIWERYCQKDFPKEERKVEECESWREMYERCAQEKDDKFKRLTLKARNSYAKIKSDSRSMKYWDKKPPKTQMKIISTREKNGHAVKALPSSTVTKRDRQAIIGATRSTPSAAGNASRSNSGGVASVPKKPKVAPMMAKTLKLAKKMSHGGGYKR